MAATVYPLILAAGAASRFGSPKALLVWERQSLLEHTIEQVEAACGNPALVVLSNPSHTILLAVGKSLRTICINDHAESGMGTSLRTGLTRIPSTADGVLVALCDQAAIPGSHYRELVDKFTAADQLACATRAQGEIMVPAVLPKHAIASISNDRGGARHWLRSQAELRLVACEAAAEDIDSPADWAHFIRARH